MTKEELKDLIKQKIKGKPVDSKQQADMIDLVIELAEQFNEANDLLKKVNEYFPLVIKAAKTASKLRKNAKDQTEEKSPE